MYTLLMIFLRHTRDSTAHRPVHQQAGGEQEYRIAVVSGNQHENERGTTTFILYWSRIDLPLESELRE